MGTIDMSVYPLERQDVWYALHTGLKLNIKYFNPCDYVVTSGEFRGNLIPATNIRVNKKL